MFGRAVIYIPAPTLQKALDIYRTVTPKTEVSVWILLWSNCTVSEQFVKQIAFSEFLAHLSRKLREELTA